MKILLTGGAGFIGSHLADLLIKNGHEVVIIDDLSSGKKDHINLQAKFYQIDITDPKVADIFIEEKPDIVNHHAAQINVRKSITDPMFDARVNIEGILNILENSRKVGVKKVIFASSGGAIYGDALEAPTKENYPAWPISPYGIAKLASEYYLNYYYKIYHLPYVALRYGNVYGPRQDSQGEAGVVAIFTEIMLKNLQPMINGDGLQTRDYVYVADVARANLLSVMTNAVGTYNIGCSKETSVIDLFQKIAQLTDFKGEKMHGPAINGEVLRSLLDITAAQKDLGWQPEYDLETGLKEVVNFWKQSLEPKA